MITNFLENKFDQKRDKKARKAQQLFGLPFSIIFSILLIIFFIVVAGIAINHFLDLRDCTQIGLFIEDLQRDVNKAWSSQSSSFEFSGSLPENLDYVCFANLSAPITASGTGRDIADDISIYQYADANLFFYPREKACNMPYHNIRHIDLEKTTGLRNPYCLAVEDGEVAIKIVKGFGEALVGLS